MTGTLYYLGLASPDGTSAKSSDRRGAVVRSGLAGAAVGIAVAAVIGFGAEPVLAEHATGHDTTARNKAAQNAQGITAIDSDVSTLETGLAAETTERSAADAALQAQIDELFELIGTLHPPQKLVFVTKQSFDGNLNGLAGADLTCNTLADAAGLPGTYLAWLSDSVSTPNDRFAQSPDPYVRVDGVQVAADYTALTGGSLDAPISIDQNGDAIPPDDPNTFDGFVWTGTAADGTRETGFGTAPNCSDWSSTNPSGRAGDAHDAGFRWTDFFSIGCDKQFQFYCFEQ